MSFWEDKLNGKNPAPVVPSRTLFGLHQPVSTHQQVLNPPGIPQNYKPNIKLKQRSNCPDCGSDKYMPYGSYAITCGECGYHPRFEQSGHGEHSLKTEPGQAKAARQSSDYQTMAGAINVLNAGSGTHIDSL